jgi:type IV pilus assembly protein PilX
LITEFTDTLGRLEKMKKLNRHNRYARPRKQKGAVLVFCLVFLAILTVMGVSGMETTILEERMSGNMRDYNLAFQAAESALKAGEAWLILQPPNLPIVSADGSTGVWSEDAMDPSVVDGKYWWDHVNINPAWWGTNGLAITSVGDVASQPTYVIEEYKTVDSGQSIGIGGGALAQPRVFHRITARGVGLNATTEIQVQSTFVQSY